jgi:hypothetical protein
MAIRVNLIHFKLFCQKEIFTGTINFRVVNQNCQLVCRIANIGNNISYSSYPLRHFVLLSSTQKLNTGPKQ